MNKKSYERLPTSAPTELTLPCLRSCPGPSSAEPWNDLYEYAWFRSLVWLIYLQSLGIAATVIAIFVFLEGFNNLDRYIEIIVRIYLGWFGFDFAILLLFAIMSLSLCHAQDNSELRWTWRAELSANCGPSKRTRLIQRVILNVSLLMLTALSASFGWILLMFT